MGSLELPAKKFKIIYADPPWTYSSRHFQDRGRDFIALNKHYPVMSIQSIKALRVCDISDDNCACFLWVTDSHLDKGVDVLKAWGFRYVTIAFVWVKKTKNGNTYVNRGPWTLKSTEVCILGIKGSMQQYKVDNTIRSLVEAERTIHSKKPEEVRNRIVKLFGDLPRIELFAREKVDGWDSYGNQVD